VKLVDTKNLICPDIKEMLVYTRDKFFNLKINTNASLLDEKISHAILESGVKTLAFSAINYYKIKYN
jgi:hypothetical protein